jgi:hypothetical protein
LWETGGKRRRSKAAEAGFASGQMFSSSLPHYSEAMLYTPYAIHDSGDEKIWIIGRFLPRCLITSVSTVTEVDYLRVDPDNSFIPGLTGIQEQA